MLGVGILIAASLTSIAAAGPAFPFAVRVASHPLPPAGMPASLRRQLVASTSTAPVQQDEYVFLDHTIDVYDINHGFRLKQMIHLAPIYHVDGAAVNTATSTLYISYGNQGRGLSSYGWILAYNLLANQVIWNQRYPVGVDSICRTRNGKTIYLPSGEYTSDDSWRVVNAQTGAVEAIMHVAPEPHNTLCGLAIRYAYLAARGSPYLYVVKPDTHRVLRRIGPLISGGRPFTVNRRETLAFTTADRLLGFQVSSLKTGHVLYTVPLAGPRWSRRSSGLPSHGITLSGNEKQIWIVDQPNDYVHVFDVSGLPQHPPRDVVDIKLAGSLRGNESTGEQRFGWLNITRNGRYALVGDAGDIIDTRTHRIVRHLAPLANTRQYLEIDWQSGVPVFAGSRYGLSYLPPQRMR